MNLHALPLILDILVMALLATTVFFAARLSLHLRDFRQNREDMDRVVRELTENILRAERAIHGMRESARDSGRDLQERINEAKALLDELDIMAQSGNSLAQRLEKTADRGRSRARAPVRPSDPDSLPSFMIMDKDQGLNEDASDDVMPDEPVSLQSRAERELFEALKGAQHRKRGARSLA